MARSSNRAHQARIAQHNPTLDRVLGNLKKPQRRRPLTEAEIAAERRRNGLD